MATFLIDPLDMSLPELLLHFIYLIIIINYLQGQCKIFRFKGPNRFIYNRINLAIEKF